MAFRQQQRLFPLATLYTKSARYVLSTKPQITRIDWWQTGDDIDLKPTQSEMDLWGRLNTGIWS